jgi:hypothetical protein
MVDEQLKGERGALHGLPPPPAIAGLADPALPEVRCQGEQVVGLTWHERPYLAEPFHFDVYALALIQGERRGDAGLLDLQRHSGAQHETAGG